MAASGEVDAVIVIFIPPLRTDPAAVARAVRDAATAGSVPVLNVVMSSAADLPVESEEAAPRLPRYRFPEDAARALVRAVEYGELAAAPGGPGARAARRPPRRGRRPARRRPGRGAGPALAGPDEVARLLGCYGLPSPSGA